VSDSSKPTGAPEVEVKLTPEAIKAGVGELYSFDERFEFAEEAVIRIYRAICRANRKTT